MSPKIPLYYLQSRSLAWPGRRPIWSLWQLVSHTLDAYLYTRVYHCTESWHWLVVHCSLFSGSQNSFALLSDTSMNTSSLVMDFGSPVYASIPNTQQQQQWPPTRKGIPPLEVLSLDCTVWRVRIITESKIDSTLTNCSLFSDHFTEVYQKDHIRHGWGLFSAIQEDIWVPLGSVKFWPNTNWWSLGLHLVFTLQFLLLSMYDPNHISRNHARFFCIVRLTAMVSITLPLSSTWHVNRIWQCFKDIVTSAIKQAHPTQSFKSKHGPPWITRTIKLERISISIRPVIHKRLLIGLPTVNSGNKPKS